MPRFVLPYQALALALALPHHTEPRLIPSDSNSSILAAPTPYISPKVESSPLFRDEPTTHPLRQSYPHPLTSSSSSQLDLYPHVLVASAVSIDRDYP